MMNRKMIDFLIEAKRATYAGKGPEIVSSRPMSHDLEYIDGRLRYLDTYLGGNKFAGQEGVWLDGKPIWAMNYAGRVLAEEFNGDFLKEALWHVPHESPYRGPKLYIRDAYTYQCSVQGSKEWFCGSEEIFCRKTKVYECLFHGGAIESEETL